MSIQMPERLHVLIAEDSLDDAELLLLELSRGGFDTVWKRVETAEEMRSALAEGGWEIILSDYSMPGLNALEALTLVRERDPDLPFIVISGTIGEVQAVEMMRAGANDYFLKDSLARLPAVVERELREVGNRRMQRQTARAAALLAALVESSEDAIVSKTMDWIVTSWNPAAERVYGWSTAEAVGRHITFIIPPDKAAEFAAAMERMRLGEHFEQFETIRIHKDGRRIDVAITLSPIRDREQRLIGVSKVARDISVRKSAELNLKNSEERYRRLFEAAQDGILIVDAESGQIADANPFLTKLLGYRREELIGKELWQIGLFRDIPSNTEAFRTIQKTGFIRYDHHPLQTKDGQQIEVEFVSNTYDVGKSRVIQCNIRDTSERKLAKDAVRASEMRLRQQSQILKLILDNMSEGVVVSDEHGNFLLLNPAAKQILHPGAADALPTKWSQTYNRLRPDGETNFLPSEQPLIKALQGEPSEEIEMIINRNRVDHPRWISVNARPMRDETGTLRGGIVVFRDVTEKKMAENALRASEVRYRTLIAATAAIVWDSPASGEFDSEQPAWTAFTGQTLAQHCGWGWLDAIHPDDREKSAKAWATAVAKRGVYQVEHRLRQANGDYRFMFVRAVPIIDASGSIREWVGVHTDISDLKHAEWERAELLTQLNLQIERLPLGYLLGGPDFRYIRWNPTAESMFGYKEEEILGKHPFETIVPPESQTQVAEVFARLAAGDMNAHGSCENVTKDGAKVVCEWHNTPLFNPDGEFLGELSLAQDVTARRQAEQELLLRDRAIAAATQGFVITDANLPDHPIIYVSPGAERITGYKSNEFLGRNCRFLQGKDTDQQTVARLRKAIGAGEPCTVELLNYRKDGTPFWNELSVSPVRDASGLLTHFIGVQTDVTARKSLEDQFHQAQKMDAFGQLAGGVAHDFNNLLTIINGYSSMLLQRFRRDDPSRKLVTEILKAGERSAQLTYQLLAFSRQQVLVQRVLNLNDIVVETDKMLRRLIGEDVILTTTLSSVMGAVRVDAGQVVQVLLNLAVNARDAMPQGGRLTIETQNVELDESYVKTHVGTNAGPHVLLSVSDTGTGMSPDVKARIFEPFFTTKGVGKGTGLGLATVFGIIKQSGGHIEVYSEVGVGTTFKVYLPRIEQDLGKSEALSKELISPRGNETVLLVEDETAVRALSREVLSECGYTVLEAADGNEARRMVAKLEAPIHLLVTDVVMPGAGGRSVAEFLRQRYPEVKVLFMSGYTDDAIIRHGVLREGVNFLQKPYSPFALATKVREVLDSPKSVAPK